jgi:energy-converting hydrogenase Eha subunit G
MSVLLQFVSELGIYGAILLVAHLLYQFRLRLDSAPPRDWSEIGWVYRLGRLMLIAAFLGVLVAPVSWLMLR